MLKSFLKFHIIPLIASVVLVFFALYLLNSYSSFKENVEEKVISGKQTKIDGRYGTLANQGEEGELNYFASIENKNQLTIFGSSELSESEYVPYNFLTAKKNVQILGLGHAYHQNLPILIELLATHKINKGSDICILISPGWFENGGGTNTKAFVEFARPNFLDRIYSTKEIPNKYKLHLAKYVFDNESNFNGVSKTMKLYSDLYKSQKSSHVVDMMNSKIKNNCLSNILATSSKQVEYKPELINPQKVKNNFRINYDSISNQLQKAFLEKSKGNKLYVNDEYYNKWLLDENGKERSFSLKQIDLSSNKELADFEILMDYIKSRKMNASFVIIPYNPYYYKNTETFLPLIDKLESIIKTNNYPCLNLYVTEKEAYEPGTLKDVMHFGDYGWMKVNQFLESIYYHE